MKGSWRNNLPKSKAIHLLVLFALLLSFITQNHLHLNDETHEHAVAHHEAEHSHAINIHTPYNDSHSITHPDVNIVSLQPEAWVKYMNDDLSDVPVAFLIVLFLLIFPTLRRISPLILQNTNNQLCRYFNLAVSRAPPSSI